MPAMNGVMLLLNDLPRLKTEIFNRDQYIMQAMQFYKTNV